MTDEQKYIYNQNFNFSNSLKDVPLIGSAMLNLQKQVCDNLITRPIKAASKGTV